MASLQGNIDQISSLGSFPIGEPVSLTIWQGKGNIGLFLSQEIDPMRPNATRRVMLIVTELEAIVVQSVRNSEIGYIVAAAPLSTLDSLSFTHSEPHKLTFSWRSGLSQVLIVNEVATCIDLISSNLFRLGVQKQKRVVNPIPSLRLEEVSKNSVAKVKITELAVQIRKMEEEVSREAKLDTVNTLMKLIQQAIEYYSAIDDPQHQVYLEKIHALLKSESVVQLLSAMDGPRATGK